MAGHIPTALSVDWCTEDRICDDLVEVFQGPVDCDPCSNPHSHVKARVAFTLETGNDGLVDEWPGKTTFENPPFGKGWWKPREHQPQCNRVVVSSGPPYCACGAANRRDYIWPGEREAALLKLGPAAFKDYIKPFKLVTIGDWIRRAADYGAAGKDVVGLLPSYPGTKAWQRHVWPKAQAIFFPEGRLHFRLVYTMPDGELVTKTGPAPMDCALPLWTRDLALLERFHKVFSRWGHVQLVRRPALVVTVPVRLPENP